MSAKPNSVKRVGNSEISVYQGWIVERTPTRVRFKRLGESGYIEAGNGCQTIKDIDISGVPVRITGSFITVGNIGPHGPLGRFFPGIQASLSSFSTDIWVYLFIAVVSIVCGLLWAFAFGFR